MARIDRSTEDSELTKLAERINAEHEAGQEATKKGLAHYHAAGVALLKAKQRCGHGKWSKWLKANVPTISERRVQRYMALAKCDVTSDLEEEWRRILGNLPSEAEAIPSPDLGDSDSDGPATVTRNGVSTNGDGIAPDHTLGAEPVADAEDRVEASGEIATGQTDAPAFGCGNGKLAAMSAAKQIRRINVEWGKIVKRQCDLITRKLVTLLRSSRDGEQRSDALNEAADELLDIVHELLDLAKSDDEEREKANQTPKIDGSASPTPDPKSEPIPLTAPPRRRVEL